MKHPFPFSGLTNKADSSFINVVLQCLSEYNLKEEYHSQISDTGISTLCINYINIAAALKSSGETLNPVSFKKSMLYLFPDQKSPEEVLENLLGALNNCFSKKNVRIEASPFSSLHYKASRKEMDSYSCFKKSILIDTFCGQYIKKITCSGCSRKTYSYKPFDKLELFPRRNCYISGLVDDKFLKDYVPQECPNCTLNSDIEHSEETMIYSLPKTLVIVLKRTEGIVVAVSETLDLGQHSFSNTDESVMYKLTSVIYKENENYFCIKSFKREFFKINDTLISKHVLETKESSSPRILFYDLIEKN